MPKDRPYDIRDYDAPSVKLDRFIKAASDQIGDKYRFGAEASEDDANPTAWDSSELVEWASHQAGFHDMPDGSWNQYRYLHDAGAAIPVDEALQTKGALVFGFSSDPLESTDRPARAYVGISLGNGKILDISERAGEVRVMDPGKYYSYGAKIPEFHAVDDTIPPPDPWAPDGGGDGTVTIPGSYGPSHDDPNVVPPSRQPEPAKSYGPDGRIIHEDLPPPEPGDPQYVPNAPTPVDPEPNVCYPDDEPEPEPNVCYPDDEPEPNVSYPDNSNIGPATLNDPALSPAPDAASYAPAGSPGFTDSYSDSGDGASYAADAASPSFADSYTDLSADV